MTFVVLGHGLAAGASDFGLSEPLQALSFPAQVAERMNVPFSQPLIESPGIGPVIGFQELPVRVPQTFQTTVLKEFPPSGPFSNLSIPGLRVADALTRRPVSPLVHRSDSLQTAINLILGLPGLVMPGQPLPTAVEYALFRQPTLVLVALGYFDVLDAAYKADASWIPDDVSFRVNLTELLAPFGRMPATTVILSTIPDPADTAYFTPVSAAARVVKAEPAVLGALFGLSDNDALTPAGLVEVGCRLIARTPGPLAAGSVVARSTMARISERVEALNAQIRSLAREHGAVLFDLRAVFARWKREGLAAGVSVLTPQFLGGIFSLNGVYPGATGHGAIANALLELINMTFATAYAPVDLVALAASDPVAQYRLADGPAVTMADLANMPPPPPAGSSPVGSSKPAAPPAPRGTRITLPPSLEVELPIDSESSYFGDALRAAHALEARDIAFASSPNTYFGGHCLTQSHLSGTITLTFTPPEGDLTHFEMTLGGGLKGADGLLVAPLFYKLPSIMNQVADIPGMVSSGDLNLATGEVENLKVVAAFMNSALLALVSVNPKIPPTPIEFSNQTRQDPQNPHYGSAKATFEARADGTFDFSFIGISFMPLGPGFGGDPLRFPLPFAGPAMHFASIPAVGSALHPHLCLSTKAPEAAADPSRVPEIPINTIREFTAFTHNTAFGDKFSLNVPEMEGGATGRSHLHGRVVIQFGGRSGNSVPFSVSTLVPGGLLARPPDSPMAQAFPGRLSLGVLGHDETLKFRRLQYPMHGVCWVDDPFEFSIGSVDVRTGRVLGPFLFRGFIVQDVLVALLAMEPRIPKASWHMRGPAAFERDANGQTVFGFTGTVREPYPEGLLFPQPDLKSAFTVGPNSQLDPFIYMQAMEGVAPPPAGKSGGARGVTASNGQKFSYSYAIPGYPAGQAAAFEYSNETTGGAFRMGSLLWVSFLNAKNGATPGDCEAVSFTGVGVWNQDPAAPHLASVQISTAPGMPYVSILIDGGTVSNVNTKPSKAVLPFPEPVVAE